MKKWRSVILAFSLGCPINVQATVMCQSCAPVEDTWECAFTSETGSNSTQCQVITIPKFNNPE